MLTPLYVQKCCLQLVLFVLGAFMLLANVATADANSTDAGGKNATMEVMSCMCILQHLSNRLQSGASTQQIACALMLPVVVLTLQKSACTFGL